MTASFSSDFEFLKRCIDSVLDSKSPRRGDVEAVLTSAGSDDLRSLAHRLDGLCSVGFRPTGGQVPKFSDCYFRLASGEQNQLDGHWRSKLNAFREQNAGAGN
jgi:hypothetical protein